MELHEAEKISGALVSVKMHGMGIGSPPDLDLLRRTSLADMVQASAMVVAENDRRHRERKPGEGITQAITADDRLTAAVYAAINYDAEEQDECEPLVVLGLDSRPSFLVHIFTKPEEA